MSPVGAMFLDMRQVGIDNFEIFMRNSERLDICFIGLTPGAYFHCDEIGLADDKDMKIFEFFIQGDEPLLKIRTQVIQKPLHSIVNPLWIKTMTFGEILHRFVEGVALGNGLKDVYVACKALHSIADYRSSTSADDDSARFSYMAIELLK